MKNLDKDKLKALVDKMFEAEDYYFSYDDENRLCLCFTMGVRFRREYERQRAEHETVPPEKAQEAYNRIMSDRISD